MDDYITEKAERAERARKWVTEVLADSAALAEQHARRAEEQGDPEGAELAWAHAAKAHAAVERLRRESSGS